MLAQRNPNAEITALDLNEDAVKLAQENFKNSPFQKDYRFFIKILKLLHRKRI